MNKSLGKNQLIILNLLDKQPDLTAKEIAEKLWNKPVQYRTKEYTTTHRSLRLLEKRGLVKKTGGQFRWRKTQ